MKRDWDLIRRIILGAEEAGILFAPEEPVREHARLLFEARLLEGIDVSTPLSFQMISVRLTWHGRDFADLIRDDEVWVRAFSRVQAADLESVPFDVLEKLLRDELIQKQIERQLERVRALSPTPPTDGAKQE